MPPQQAHRGWRDVRSGADVGGRCSAPIKPRVLEMSQPCVREVGPSPCPLLLRSPLAQRSAIARLTPLPPKRSTTTPCRAFKYREGGSTRSRQLVNAVVASAPAPAPASGGKRQREQGVKASSPAAAGADDTSADGACGGEVRERLRRWVGHPRARTCLPLLLRVCIIAVAVDAVHGSFAIDDHSPPSLQFPSSLL